MIVVVATVGLVIVVLAVLYYLFMSPSSQIFGKVHYKFTPNGKQIALTFDDGPNEPHTSNLLSVLETHNVKATFFTCGECIKRHPGVINKIIEAGHEVGSHSAHHKFMHYFKPKSYVEEVSRTSAQLESITGVKPTLYRSPWLFRTPNLLRDVHTLGLIPIWGVFGSEIEVLQPSANTITRRALQVAKPGRILIFHDGKESVGGNRAQTIEAINLLIPKLKSQGYEFVQVTQNLLES